MIKTRMLRWADCCISFTAPESVFDKILNWLHPWLQGEGGAAPSAALTLVVDGRLSVPNGGRQISIHSGALARTPYAPVAHQSNIIWREDRQGSYSIAPNSVLCTYLTESRAVTDGMIVLRSLLVEIALRAGGVLRHAAMLSVDGNSVALLGGKGAGKTSTLLGLLSRGAILVSNDKVLVHGSTVWGLPQAIRISPFVAAHSLLPIPPHSRSDSTGSILIFPSELHPTIPVVAHVRDVRGFRVVSHPLKDQLAWLDHRHSTADLQWDSFTNRVHARWVSAAVDWPAPKKRAGSKIWAQRIHADAARNAIHVDPFSRRSIETAFSLLGRRS